MKKIKSLLFLTLFLVTPLIFPLTLKGEDITFMEVTEKVFRVRSQCTECHGESLSHGIVKRALNKSTDEEIRDNTWYPIEDCDVSLDDISKKILLKWIAAGMPE